MAELYIQKRQAGDVKILDLYGNITIGVGGKELSSAIRNSVMEGNSKILLNLAKVRYVDSSGLGNLISGFNTVRRDGGQLKLLNLTQSVRDIMVINVSSG